MLPSFVYRRPTKVSDAIEALGADRLALGGGTELLLAMKAGLMAPEELVEITRLDELLGIRVEPHELIIGSANVHRDIARHPEVRTLSPLLASVEGAVGNTRVRSQGTIGGNLCFAEPRSDVATALMALGASVRLQGSSSLRRVLVGDFVVGPYTTTREEDELLLSVHIPLPGPDRAVYEKFQTMERPTVGVALAAQRDGSSARLAVGAVGPTPLLWEVGDIEEIEPDAIAAAVDPMEDLGGSAAYKRHITSVYVGRAVEALKRGRE